MTRRIIPFLAALCLIPACADNAQEAPDGTTPADSAAVSTTAPGGSAPNAAPGFDKRDPETGSIALKAEGGHPGSWTFQDVNGSLTEQTGGGQTTSILQIEGHDDPVHLRLRLLSPDGEITPGRYAVGGNAKGLDATYENTGMYYKSLGKASGAVELTRMSDNRAVGSYDLTLESLAEGNATTKVRGTFDLRVQQ